jgi:very-short-patch-repair endonuclease
MSYGKMGAAWEGLANIRKTPPLLAGRGGRLEKAKQETLARRLYNSDMPIPGPGAVVRAKRLRQESTLGEEALWERLRDRRFLGLKFRRQVPIGAYVADFYCHDRKLVLEIDGGIHEEERQKAHDENRDSNLTALGYRILRLTNGEILEDLDSALETIRQRLERRQPA